MEKFTVDYISALTKDVNKARYDLFESMNWAKPPVLSEGDVRIVLEVANNQSFKKDGLTQCPNCALGGAWEVNGACVKCGVAAS